jgi:hypothetical protein
MKTESGIVFVHIGYSVLNVPTDLVHKILAQYSACCLYVFVDFYCEFMYPVAARYKQA